MPSKFDFISPDILLREVDMSEVPPNPTDEGLMIIGQAPKGPAMKPVVVKNLRDLKDVFGSPYAGDPDGDIYRNGNTANPGYGLFAAQAWLASNTSPVTYMRLAGEETGGAFATADKQAGWDLGGVAYSPSTAGSQTVAYGLWMVPSASSGTAESGSLAAVFYTKGASMLLSGTVAGTSDTTASVGTMIKSIGDNAGFKLQVYDGSNTTDLDFNMATGGQGFIREVCNTDPQKLISGQKSETLKYFLGESYETEIADMMYTSTSGSAGTIYGMLLPLAKENSSSNSWINHISSFTAAKTGWFIENDPNSQQSIGSFDPSNMKKLFRFHSLIEGSDFQKQYCMRITIDALGSNTDPYTKFTVAVYDMYAKNNVDVYQCNLNPNSDDYIAKVIGNQEVTYSASKKKYITKGEFPNLSSFIRVEMSGESYSKRAIPFGFYGPSKPKDWAVAGNATPADIPAALDVGTGATYVAAGTVSLMYGGHSEVGWANYQVTATSSFSWPSINLTDDNAGYKKLNYFGFRHQPASDGNTSTARQYDVNSMDYIDILRALPDGLAIDGTGAYTETSFIFTLDDLVAGPANSNTYYYEAGSHQSGDAFTCTNSASVLIETEGVNKLAAPFMGGTDGLDIQYVDPFSSYQYIGSGDTALNNYAMAAIDKAIDVASDSELIKYDLITMPGIHKASLVDTLLGNTAERADALAIVDVDSGFVSGLEKKEESEGSVTTVVSNIKTEDYDTSYGATYYPEVKIKTSGGGLITVPSSVAGIGAIASSEAASGAPWFAPAGFNRGGISQLGGPTGPKVAAVAESLNKADRDKLYLVNINPIANFPSEGPVVFGQKTLQQTPSALDRINVRRLMIYLKKRIGAVARTILFDNNVNATWNRFKAGANPILSDAKSRFGLADYKLVLDETTTTPDLIDRNIMYAQVYIKPAYAIEFIAIDFNITRSGIEF
jgi:hypothetical protein